MSESGELAKAWVTIIPTARGMTKGIEDELGSVGGKAGKTAGKGFLGGFAGIATAAAGAALVGGFLKGAITAAGDLEQSTGAIDAVFKDSAGQMHGWAKEASNAVGLTQNEFNELGTLIGSQLKNGGTAMDQLAPKTNDLIGLGADLSSMFGGTTREAIEAVSSALKGERDPIEKYGVSLNQAAVDAKAAELGFKKVGGALSMEANQAATVALIMEQTSDAQGNFSKESSTFAGQLQRLTSAWGNVSATVGTVFLPMLTGALTFINGSIMPAIQSFSDSLGAGGLGAAFTAIGAIAGPIFSQLGAMFGPLIPQILDLVTSFSPLAMIFQLIQPFLPQLAAMFMQVAAAIAQILGVVIPLVQEIMSTLMPVFMELVGAVLPPLIEIIGSIVSALGPLIEFLGPILTGVIKALMPVVTTVFGLIQTVITTVIGIVQGIIGAFTAALNGDWDSFWDNIGSIFSTALGGIGEFAGKFFGELPGKILGALGNLGGLLLDAGGQIMAGLGEGLMAGFKGVQDFIGGIGTWIAENKGPKAYDLALLVPAGGWIMDGLGKGIEDEMPALGSTLADVSWMIQNGIDPTATASMQLRASNAITTAAPRPGTGVAPAGGGEGLSVTQEIHANDTEEIIQEANGRMFQTLREAGVL